MNMIHALNLKQKLLHQVCDYSDAYILVAGDIKVAAIGADTNVAFKNFAPFTRCATQTNDEHIDTAENLDIMSMYNLIEYSDNYSETSGSLWQFKRDQQSMNNAGNPVNFAKDNSPSFKYKSSTLGKATTSDGNDRSLKKCKNSRPIKVFKQFLAIIRNAFD